MESNCKNRTLQWISTHLKDGTISLSHKLQRKEGQWNRQVKSELIDSLLRNYPINPVYGVRDGEILSIIDGVQRISTIRDYMDDKFALSKTLEPIVTTKVIIKEDGKPVIEKNEFVINNKKFSKLDDKVKELLIASELQIYELTNCTDKDVREMFRRQNSGKALNSTQLRSSIESDKFSDIIFSLTSHSFFDKVLSSAQRRKDLDKDLAIETLMLIETNNENDFACFKSKNINNFIIWYQEDIKYEKIELLKQGLDKLDESFEELKVNTVSIPMILYSSYRILKDKKSFSKLVDAIRDFVSGYEMNDSYKQFCQSGTTSAENVRGRLEYWRKIIKTL